MVLKPTAWKIKTLREREAGKDAKAAGSSKSRALREREGGKLQRKGSVKQETQTASGRKLKAVRDRKAGTFER